MEEISIEKMLEKIFSNVNSWLNFAEAKNAANVALAVAGISAIFSWGDMNTLLYIICILLALSGICSLLSFIPQLETKAGKWLLGFITKEPLKDGYDNLLFFEVIKRYSGKEYVELLGKTYLQKEYKEMTKYQLDIANEIVYNAHVASRKYKLFKIATYMDIVAFMILVMGFVVA